MAGATGALGTRMLAVRLGVGREGVLVEAVVPVPVVSVEAVVVVDGVLTGVCRVLSLGLGTAGLELLEDSESSISS